MKYRQLHIMLERLEGYPGSGIIRPAIGSIIAPALSLTGYRFSKRWRHGDTIGHRLGYLFIDTVGANIRADRYS